MAFNRTYVTKKNAYASVINRCVALLCNFVSRTVFIRTLGKIYLGVGGMFGNVFSVLSIVELGFGEAITQCLYKPIAENDINSTLSLVRYYSKIYKYIAVITFSISVLFYPFLPVCFHDIVKIEHYKFIYFLFIAHQMLMFRFAPKRALIMCDGKLYFIMWVRTLFSVLSTVFQILFLVCTNNYITFIFLRIFFSTLEGLLLEKYANKHYGLNKFKYTGIQNEYRQKIKKSTFNLSIHRIGGVINNSTDSFLLSSVLGLSHMGIYSNYALIINSIGSFVCLAVNSAKDAIGNLGASENAEKSENILNVLCFCNFVLVFNVSAFLLSLINPIIEIWLGKDMCFNFYETGVIVACFFVSYFRDPVQIYLNTFGIFKETKFIPITRGILNLIISYILVGKYGVAGVFGGTLISTLIIPFWAEPYILFKYGFEKNFAKFFKRYTGYFLCGISGTFICFLLTDLIKTENELLSILLKVILTVLFTNALIITVFPQRVKEMLTRIKQKNKPHHTGAAHLSGKINSSFLSLQSNSSDEHIQDKFQALLQK